MAAPSATVHVVRGAPEDAELAAVIAVLHAMSSPAQPADLTLRPRRAPWAGPPRHRSNTSWAAEG